jgi:hypothetical protein
MHSRERIKELLELEVNQSETDINELENYWISLIDNWGNSDWEVLIEYNRFRLRNLKQLCRKRPAVLIGAINDGYFPNFHTIELLSIADVISLTTKKDQADSIDRIKYSLLNDSIQSIVSRFPVGFKPTFYWDSQAEHGHPQPMGLSNAPFPTVCGICHMFFSPAIKRLLEVFDYVLPVGEVFDQFCLTQNNQILRVPFGLNWASMHHLFGEGINDKDIDVSVTFSDSKSGPYGSLRAEILSKLKILKEKLSGKYKIEITSDLNKEEYSQILLRSKISVNVVGFNGPYNYRTCEIINSGALLFQANFNSHNVKPDPEELFKSGEHFVSFDLDNMEDKLNDLLSNPELVSQIAKNGKNKLEKELNYKNLFNQLIKKVRDAENQKAISSKSQKNPFADKFKKAVQSQENKLGDFHIAVFLWEQTKKQTLRDIGAGLISKMLHQFDDSRFFCNLLAIAPEIFENFGFSYLKSLVAIRNKEFADSLVQNDLRQIVIQIYSLQHDHVVMAYNMISIAMEGGWIDKQQLPALANQAFGGKDWRQYDSSWLLRHPILSDDVNQNILYNKFQIPLLLAKGNLEIWRVYRDYLLYFANDD